MAMAMLRKAFNWNFAFIQRFLLLSWWEAWRHAGRRGAGVVIQTSTSGSAGRRKSETLSSVYFLQ